MPSCHHAIMPTTQHASMPSCHQGIFAIEIFLLGFLFKGAVTRFFTSFIHQSNPPRPPINRLKTRVANDIIFVKIFTLKVAKTENEV
jgi:hypothetical protein